MLLRIGQLAKRSGLTVRTLHHYDAVGLLSPSERSSGGYRLYTREDVARLHRIQALKQLGCSLWEVGEILSDQAVSPADILTRQLETLQAQIERVTTLRDRLALIRDRVAQGGDGDMEEWLDLLELAAFFEKRFTAPERESLRAGKKAVPGLRGAWRNLASRIGEAMARKADPAGEAAPSLAREWLRLARRTSNNQPELAMKLRVMMDEEVRFGELTGLTSDKSAWVSAAVSTLRARTLATRLSPGEVDEVLKRHAAHRQEWTDLVTRVRLCMERGVPPDNPEAMALGTEWNRLFEESYSGGDVELGDRIRQALAAEPDLFPGIGVDEAMLGFVRWAGSGGAAPATSTTAGKLMMIPPKPTAWRVAIMRAAHQLLDTPLVFGDTLACRIVGEEEVRNIQVERTKYDSPLARGVRASAAARSRLAWDAWSEARERGVRQLVVLGAGLDTTAYRILDGEGLSVIEADLPATQFWKRELLRRAGILEPSWLTFAPVDFERQDLGQALSGAGFSAGEPAFITWLGVTMYLDPEHEERTLAWAASLAEGSCIVFDYGVVPQALNERERKGFDAISSRAAEKGEPWKSLHDPASVPDWLMRLGFSRVEHFGPEEINPRYFEDRQDGLRKSGVSRLVLAHV